MKKCDVVVDNRGDENAMKTRNPPIIKRDARKPNNDRDHIEYLHKILLTRAYIDEMMMYMNQCLNSKGHTELNGEYEFFRFLGIMLYVSFYDGMSRDQLFDGIGDKFMAFPRLCRYMKKYPF